jgi:PAS domain-containing protein
LSDLAGLLKLLQETQDPARRLEAILDWLCAALSARGAVVLEKDDASHAIMAVGARGSLMRDAEEIAAAWTGTALPRAAGIAVSPSTAHDAGDLYFLPVFVRDGATVGAIALRGDNLPEVAAKREADLLVISALTREVIENDDERREQGRAMALAGLFQGVSSVSTITPGLTLLSDGLRLPLYVCDRKGRFLYASPAFLNLTGFPTLEALAAHGDFFRDPSVRAEELEKIATTGKVTSFPLSVTAGNGAKLTMHDSVVALADSFFGVFFDVTALMAGNAELKDALQVQELLNDSILAGTKMLQRTQGASIRSLARLAEYRDPETGYHLQRICEYTRILALQVRERSPYSFRITREYGDDISLSSMLHDIGKVSIPDSILLKTGKLEPHEWELMKKHTVFGWEVLHKADRELGEQSFLTLAATIALSHHERFDGSGYPNGSA